jgi:dipeptidase
MIGKGVDEKGAVWVTRRIPDGYVSAHANQARIRQFPLDDPKNCIYSKDVISFARKKGYFKGKDKDFSFADTYAPTSCRDLRVREGRVWSMYRRVAPSLKISGDYVNCKKGAKNLPLWIKPDKKISVHEMMELMRDHFEGTEFDMTKDVGAGPYELPYRWRPLVWEYEGKKYVNERATATQQTGFSFVAQSRENFPGIIGGVLWFSVDDAASTVYVPMYMGIAHAPKSYAVGTGDFKTFSWDSAFWIFNWVSNFAYTRYKDIIVDIRKVQNKFETGFLAKQDEIDKKAMELYKKSPKKAMEFLTKYSDDSAALVVSRWKLLGTELLMKYMDGNVRDEKGKVTHPPYPKHWYKRIVDQKGKHFLLSEKDPKLTFKERAALPDPVVKTVVNKENPEKTDKKDGKPEKCNCQKSSGCACKVSHQSNTPYLLIFLITGMILIIRKKYLK